MGWLTVLFGLGWLSCVGDRNGWGCGGDCGCGCSRWERHYCCGCW